MPTRPTPQARPDQNAFAEQNDRVATIFGHQDLLDTLQNCEVIWTEQTAQGTYSTTVMVVPEREVAGLRTGPRPQTAPQPGERQNRIVSGRTSKPLKPGRGGSGDRVNRVAVIQVCSLDDAAPQASVKLTSEQDQAAVLNHASERTLLRTLIPLLTPTWDAPAVPAHPTRVTLTRYRYTPNGLRTPLAVLTVTAWPGQDALELTQQEPGRTTPGHRLPHLRTLSRTRLPVDLTGDVARALDEAHALRTAPDPLGPAGHALYHDLRHLLTDIASRVAAHPGRHVSASVTLEPGSILGLSELSGPPEVYHVPAFDMSVYRKKRLDTLRRLQHPANRPATARLTAGPDGQGQISGPDGTQTLNAEVCLLLLRLAQAWNAGLHPRLRWGQQDPPLSGIAQPLTGSEVRVSLSTIGQRDRQVILDLNDATPVLANVTRTYLQATLARQ